MNRLPTLTLAAAALLTAAHAHAADPYPNKPVTLVTAFAPGSGPDAVLRLVADKLGKAWNQRVLVDNRPGGGGFIAIDTAKRATADGYTLLQLDSEHLAALFRTPFFIAVPANSPWRSVGDLVAAAKAKPNGISYGSWGVGTPAHLGAQQLEMLSGLNMLHIPFREVGQLYSSVATGEVSWAFGTLPSSRGVYETGKLRYLAVAAPRRVPQMPQVPTVAEAGGPQELNFNGFVVLVAPKGVNPALAARINGDVVAALRDPDVTAQYNTFAFEALDWSAANVRQEVEARSGLYRRLIERGNIRLD
jgi:tripartite-type tricarboxylate transporter receptor subunit TctC